MDVSEVEQHPVERRECDTHGCYEARRYAVMPSGRELWTVCPECSNERQRKEAEEQRKREVDRERERLEARIKRACIPSRFLSRTLEGFVADTPGKSHALDVAQEFGEQFKSHYESGTTVVFSGRPGTGKSHLACALAQDLAKAGNWVMYATARELVLMLRDTWRNDSERSERALLDDFIRMHLLVIDEVGVGFGSEAEKIQFFDVIDGRYREQKPTILLTNLDKKGLSDYIGQRAFDRLREGGIWVAFDWESHRGKA